MDQANIIESQKAEIDELKQKIMDRDRCVRFWLMEPNLIVVKTEGSDDKEVGVDGVEGGERGAEGGEHLDGEES